MKMHCENTFGFAVMKNRDGDYYVTEACPDMSHWQPNEQRAALFTFMGIGGEGEAMLAAQDEAAALNGDLEMRRENLYGDRDLAEAKARLGI